MKQQKTLSQMVLDQKHSIRETMQKERAELRTLEALAKVIPERYTPSMVICHTLYGSIATVFFGESFIGMDSHQCSMSEVAALLDSFPPVKVWHIRDGCCALRPDWDVSDTEIQGKQGEDVFDIWGVTLKIEPGVNSGGAHQVVEWYTERDGVRFEINCYLSPSCWPVNVECRCRHSRSGRVDTVEDTQIQARGKFWLDRKIRWGRGGSEYAHQFTCYWLAIDDSEGAGKTWLETICQANAE